LCAIEAARCPYGRIATLWFTPDQAASGNSSSDHAGEVIVRVLAGPVAGVLAALLLALTACGTTPDCERIAGVRSGVCLLPVDERRAAPDLRLPVLEVDAAAQAASRVEGDSPDELSLADLQGRIVIVNFWASWCGPCRIEQPDLNAAWALLPADEVVLIGVNIEDTEANALAHLNEFAVPYASLFDPVNALAGRFEGIGARTIPSTVFLDREGRVAARLLGLAGLGEVVGLADALASEAAGVR
jgi:thiol-disulfide isomerase/thioredoxin